ncbi:MAG: flagellar basal-body rod protein FlgF [Desulfovibrionaceae bacterium]
MEQSMLTSVFAAVSVEKKLDIVANNLANVNTTGFKRGGVTFQDTMKQFAYDEMRQPIGYIQEEELFPEAKNMARVRIVGNFIQMEQGSLRSTGNSLDIALQGDGLFKMQGPEGIMYTRAGSFTKDAEGVLMTPAGYPVLGEGGPIVLPAGAKNIVVNELGEIIVDGAQIDTLDIVSVESGALQRFGNGLFAANASLAVVENPSTAIVTQGFLEGSNVNAIEEMLSLMQVQRQYEVYQTAIQTSSDISKVTINKIGSTV